ncbi:MAG: hypothetical protein ACOYKE_00160 [Ferruginibacter sp.]
MKVDFDNIYTHIIPMPDFPLKMRFTNSPENAIPEIHLNQLKPLDKIAAKFLWDYIFETQLHDDVPFKKGFFQNIDKAKILLNNEATIKKWLYHRGLPFNKPVFLSWQPYEAMVVPWKLFIKYFECFYYADDLTIFDQSLTWALLFYHESEIYFGTNKDFKPSDNFNDYSFIW